MGRVSFPLLMVVGEGDKGFPCKEAAEDIKEMMEQAGKGHLIKILSYPKTGHILQPPYMPLTTMTHMRGFGMQLWGGEPHPHCCAQEDSWRKMLMFLREHLHKDISNCLDHNPDNSDENVAVL